MKRLVFLLFIVNGTLFSSQCMGQEVVEQPIAKKDILASFPGGDAALDSFITANLSTTTLAVAGNVSGEVIIRFVIDENGLAGDFTVLKKLGYGCDEQAIRVLQQMPRWQGGEIGGRKIKTTLQQSFRFTLQMHAVKVEVKETPKLIPDAPLAFGEKEEDLQQYLQQSFVYPASIKKNVPGVIMVKFRVNTNGKAEDIQVISGLHTDLDKEVIRVIEIMPAWKAKQVNFRPTIGYRELTIGFKKKKPLLY